MKRVTLPKLIVQMKSVQSEGLAYEMAVRGKTRPAGLRSFYSGSFCSFPKGAATL